MRGSVIVPSCAAAKARLQRLSCSRVSLGDTTFLQALKAWRTLTPMLFKPRSWGLLGYNSQTPFRAAGYLAG